MTSPDEQHEPIPQSGWLDRARDFDWIWLTLSAGLCFGLAKTNIGSGNLLLGTVLAIEGVMILGIAFQVAAQQYPGAGFNV